MLSDDELAEIQHDAEVVVMHEQEARTGYGFSGSPEARRAGLRAVEAAVRADMQPREVRTIEELDALPAFSVIRIQQNATLEKMTEGWFQAGIETPYIARQIWLPAQILFTPSTPNQQGAEQ